MGTRGGWGPASSGLEELLGWLRTARFSRGLECPRCGGRRIQRWGRFSGRQRYRCGGCRRTFSDLTGTPAAYIKKLGKWPCYGWGMERGESLRAAAGRLGIHPSTAFRWRHRLLEGLRARDRERLEGWVELGVLGGFPESKKGQRRGLGRPARRRADNPYPGTIHRPPKVWVLVAQDRRGHVVTGPVRRRLLESADLERVLAGRLEGGPAGGESVLVTGQGRLRPLEGFTARSGIPVVSRRTLRHPLVQTERPRVYWFVLKSWMRRFRGVATRYLRNYLVWHRWLHRALRHGSREAILRWGPA